MVPWRPEKGVSYAAGIACIHYRKRAESEILLVLTKEEIIRQTDGSDFVKRSAWQLPIGTFEPGKDADLVVTAIRETKEEAGYKLPRSAVEEAPYVSRGQPSDREGSDKHETITFLVGLEELPEKVHQAPDPHIKRVAWFPLSAVLTHYRPKLEGVAMASKHWYTLSMFADQIRRIDKEKKGCKEFA